VLRLCSLEVLFLWSRSLPRSSKTPLRTSSTPLLPNLCYTSVSTRCFPASSSPRRPFASASTS
jgi:hypothetical protein